MLEKEPRHLQLSGEIMRKTLDILNDIRQVSVHALHELAKEKPETFAQAGDLALRALKTEHDFINGRILDRERVLNER